MTKSLKKILIAEDSPEWQKMHVSLLNMYQKVPIEFTVANNARDAIELVEQNINEPYDLILTDLQMETEFLPEFAGEWLVKQIKNLSEYKRIPIVIISAAYNIGFIASTLGTNYLSKRNLINNPNSYFLMLDENLK